MKYRETTRVSALTAAVLAAVLAAAGGAMAAPPEPTWGESLWNPQPLDDDRVLPMPCGGAMVLRPVPVRGEAAFDDERVVLGGNNTQYNYKEGQRRVYVAATFPDAARAGRVFYLGKYEVSQPQLTALGPDCKLTDAAVADETAMAADGLAWTDAVTFAADYSAWLLKHHGDVLGGIDGAPAYLRLPTEAEWEYAARGGVAVSGAEFEAARFPMPDGMEEYVWYSDPQQSEDEVQEVGQLQPNPLGLHDMLGNVYEYVLDPYRLNAVGRLHGQVGGWLAKGGSSLSSAANIRSADRREVMPFSQGALNRPGFVGFRLLLSAPVERSVKQIGELQAQWVKVQADTLQVAQAPPAPAAPASEPADAPETDPFAGRERSDNPVEEFETLVRAAPSDAYRARLLGLRNAVQVNNRLRNESRAIAVRSQLRTAAITARELRRQTCQQTGFGDTADEFQPLIDLAASDEERIMYTELYETAIAKRDAEAATIAFNLGIYEDILADIAQAYPADLVQTQARIVAANVRDRQWTVLEPYVPLVTEHVTDRMNPATPTASHAQLRAALDAVPEPGRDC